MKHMMNKNPYQSYQTSSVTTASPGELTLMLYNGGIKFIRLAKIAIQKNNMTEKNINIQKAQRIVQEFMITLNMNYEISKQMMPLYEYMYNRLIEANVQSSDTILEEVENLMVQFRDTWKQVMATQGQ